MAKFLAKRSGRKGRNMAEDRLIGLAAEIGVGLTRRGYPDFAVVRRGEIVGFVEVKPNSYRSLKPSQSMFQQLCEEKGIPFALWSPDDPIPAFVKGAAILD